MSALYTPLLQHIRKFVPIAAAEEEMLLACLQFKKVNNKEFLLEAGQVCRALYFVTEGCFRQYLLTDDGHDQIIQFGIERWWITDYASLETRQPSVYSIQAVENGGVIVLEKQQQEILLQQVPQLERYFRLILQRAYSATLTRVHYMLNFSGEKRYHHFNDSFPDFVQRVPQYMLASYLGFTPEFLSKIRARRL